MTWENALRCFLCLSLSLSLELITLGSCQWRLFTVFFRISRWTSPIELLLEFLVKLCVYILFFFLTLNLSNKEEVLSFSAFFRVSRVNEVSDIRFVFFWSNRKRLHVFAVWSSLSLTWLEVWTWIVSLWISPSDALILSHLFLTSYKITVVKENINQKKLQNLEITNYISIFSFKAINCSNKYWFSFKIKVKIWICLSKCISLNSVKIF